MEKISSLIGPWIGVARSGDDALLAVQDDVVEKASHGAVASSRIAAALINFIIVAAEMSDK